MRRIGIAGKFVLTSVAIFAGLGIALTVHSASQLRQLITEQNILRVDAQALNWIQANQNQILLTPDSDVINGKAANLREREGIAYVQVLDAKGNILGTAGVQPVIVSRNPIAPVPGVTSTVASVTDADGRTYFELSTPIRFSGTGMNPELESLYGMVRQEDAAVLRTGVDQSVIDRSLSGVLSRTVLQFGGMMMLALLTNIFLARRIVTPITQLARAARQIAAGSTGAVRQAEDRDDEIGDLVRDFNQMAQRLAEHREEMDELNAGLEVKVRERTLALEEANQKLKELDALKSNFLSTVSHEFRSPLTSIKAFAQILMDSSVDPATTMRFLDIIDKESDRLSRLISDLLDKQRFELVPLRLEKCELREVVSKGLAPLSFRRRSKGLRVELSANGPCPVQVDPDQIQQVVTNLVDNAIKFSPEGGVIRLKLMVRNDSGPERGEEGRYALLAVSDDGPGVAADEQRLIFNPFYRSARNRPAAPGTGLGLSICREIVVRHKGEIWVESGSGTGSTFYLTTPLACDGASCPCGLE